LTITQLNDVADFYSHGPVSGCDPQKIATVRAPPGHLGDSHITGHMDTLNLKCAIRESRCEQASDGDACFRTLLLAPVRADVGVIRIEQRVYAIEVTRVPSRCQFSVDIFRVHNIIL